MVLLLCVNLESLQLMLEEYFMLWHPRKVGVKATETHHCYICFLFGGKGVGESQIILEAILS